MPAAKKAKVTFTPADEYMSNLLLEISEGNHAVSVQEDEEIFSQGARANSIYFVQTGRVKVSVVSYAGKEAVLAMQGPGSFLGGECLAGQSLRISTATTLKPSTLFRIEKRAMHQALHNYPDLSERFMSSLLRRNIDIEEDLCDHLFNHSEKRLARVLLKLSRMREYEVAPDPTIPTLSHQTLAEMVGTTRSRISHFMNNFRRMGLIEYNGHAGDNGFELTVRTERLTDLLSQD